MFIVLIYKVKVSRVLWEDFVWKGKRRKERVVLLSSGIFFSYVWKFFIIRLGKVIVDEYRR